MFERIQSFDPVIAHRQKQVLHDQKWFVFLHRASVFRHVPFIRFVFASGSMATGDVKPTSDFDVIVGCKYGRMFTARLFLILTLDVLGWRRKNLDHNSAAAADTICLNHFVTEEAMQLAPPHAGLWKELYRSLVPVFGSARDIAAFWKANEDWMGEGRPYVDDLRHVYREGSRFQRGVERFLSGGFGDWFEQLVRAPQLRRISEKLAPHVGYKPRLHCDDTQLELHLETRPGYE